jgi:hypothetical protein
VPFEVGRGGNFIPPLLSHLDWKQTRSVASNFWRVVFKWRHMESMTPKKLPKPPIATGKNGKREPVHIRERTHPHPKW